MNSSATNVGGWSSSSMETYLNSTIYHALPKALQQSIIRTTVVSGHGSSESYTFETTDKLYLLSTQEVLGGYNSYDTASSKTRQLDYYKNKGVTTSNYSAVVKKSNGSNLGWWLRSVPNFNSSNFYHSNESGNLYNSYAHFGSGVSPAFRIA